MMEDHEFCDSCKGCRPALMDLETGQSLPDSDPLMIAVNLVWDNDTTYAQRRAFIEVTLKNSRRPHDLKLFQEVSDMLQAVLNRL